MTSPLISVAELRERLGELTVLDVRYQLGAPGREDHLAGHVPGAVYVDLDTHLAGPTGHGLGRHPLPAPNHFADAMARAGVSRSRPVVVYDDWSGHAAARCWWLLRHHAHPDVRVLDGGWSAWVADGGEQSTAAPQPDRGDFTADPGHLPVVSAETLQHVEVLVDARAAERYRGESEPIDPVAGHIPGAVNVPTSRNLTADGCFRDPVELAAVYAEVGAVPGAAVAAYCGSGVTACHDILAMSVVGVDAALYPGSWSEWVADGKRPVQRR